MQGVWHPGDPALVFGSYRYLLVAPLLPLIQSDQDKSCEGYICLRALVTTLWMQNHTHNPFTILETPSPVSPD